MNQITTIAPTNLDFLIEAEVALLKRTLLAKYPEDEQDSFIRICQRTRLDPFTKQIHATRRYQKVRQLDGTFAKVPTLVPVTAIMGLTAVADRTGNYNGCEVFWCGSDGVWKTEWLADEPPAAAKCVVYHKKRDHPEVAIARWNSFVGQTYNYETKRWEVSDFWDRMPDWMLAKCSKAAALRGAFPDQLSNVFIHEELDSNITDSETSTEAISPDEQKVIDNQRRAAEDKAKHPEEYVTPSRPAPKLTPAEVVEPLFTEDKVPPKAAVPAPPAPRPQQQPAQAPVAPAQPVSSEPPDDLDMGPETPAPTPAAVAPAEEPAPKAEVAPWRDHVILGIKRYYGQKIGQLAPGDLAVIEQKWMSAAREQWDDATDAQRADYTALEAAIAYHKTQRPW